MNEKKHPAELPFTPFTEDGPLYPPVPFPRSSDMTNGGLAAGTPLSLQGHVYDFRRQPVANALVEVWQADSNGYYTHPRAIGPDALDPYWQITPDQLDSNFLYFSSVETDASGHYAFKTIVPRWYHVLGTDRAAHIHMKVRSEQNGVVTTEIYFSGEEQDGLRGRDRVFGTRLDEAALVVELTQAEGAGGASAGLVCHRDIVFRYWQIRRQIRLF